VLGFKGVRGERQNVITLILPYCPYSPVSFLPYTLITLPPYTLMPPAPYTLSPTPCLFDFL